VNVKDNKLEDTFIPIVHDICFLMIVTIARK
jgi:hypothetical protein